MAKNKSAYSTAVLLGKRIKELRKERRMTQDELAEKTGASLNTITSIERGIRSPSIDLLDRISQALQVPIKDLFDYLHQKETIESPARDEILSLVEMLKRQPARRVRTIIGVTKNLLPKLK